MIGKHFAQELIDAGLNDGVNFLADGTLNFYPKPKPVDPENITTQEKQAIDAYNSYVAAVESLKAAHDPDDLDALKNQAVEKLKNRAIEVQRKKLQGEVMTRMNSESAKINGASNKTELEAQLRNSIAEMDSLIDP